MTDAVDRWFDLIAELRAGLGDDAVDEGDLQLAASVYCHSAGAASDLRRGLLDGYAYELDWLESRAERLVAEGEALARLVAHVKATHPRARRRARRAESATALRG